MSRFSASYLQSQRPSCVRLPSASYAKLSGVPATNAGTGVVVVPSETDKVENAAFGSLAIGWTLKNYSPCRATPSGETSTHPVAPAAAAAETSNTPGTVREEY